MSCRALSAMSCRALFPMPCLRADHSTRIFAWTQLASFPALTVRRSVTMEPGPYATPPVRWLARAPSPPLPLSGCALLHQSEPFVALPIFYEIWNDFDDGLSLQPYGACDTTRRCPSGVSWLMHQSAFRLSLNAVFYVVLHFWALLVSPSE